MDGFRYWARLRTLYRDLQAQCSEDVDRPCNASIQLDVVLGHADRRLLVGRNQGELEVEMVM